jgi:hypothetical protein
MDYTAGEFLAICRTVAADSTAYPTVTGLTREILADLPKAWDARNYWLAEQLHARALTVYGPELPIILGLITK